MLHPSPSSSSKSPRISRSSNSFLQQLLEEIHESSTPSSDRPQSIKHRDPQHRPIPTRDWQPSSVWSSGGPLAEDARMKLRAADQARLRRAHLSSHDGTSDDYGPPSEQSLRDSDQLRDNEKICSSNHLTTASRRRLTAINLRLPQLSTCNVRASRGLDSPAILDSPPIFCDIDSNISSTPSPTDVPTSAVSTTVSDATSTSGDWLGASLQDGTSPFRKRSLSQASSPEPYVKRLHTRIPPTSRPGFFDCTKNRKNTQVGSMVGDSAGDSPRTPISPTVTSHPFPTSRKRVQIKPTSDHQSSSAYLDANHFEAQTPPYARSLHLVDTEVSIYKKIHGDEWVNYPLCLYCFRTHGDFCRMSDHGYEACGRKEALDSHYWEASY